MPLYLCTTTTNALTPTAKTHIANAITDIHCEVTGAPASFVHVAFFANSEQAAETDALLQVNGTIRKGRSKQQKQNMSIAIQTALNQHSGIAMENCLVNIQETPASWVLEGGEIMPEPGDEAEWLAKKLP